MTIDVARCSTAAPESLSMRIATAQRRKMYDTFLHETGISSRETLLDIGVTSDRSCENSNFLEAWYPFKHRVTATGLDDASFLEGLYPGMTFRRADGRELPFADGSFDFVHSNAVIEHDGGSANQERFLREAWRVARKGIFVTTPNRWFPVEFHTVLPLLHWLPKSAHRRILRLAGLGYFAEEANLNLLSGSEFVALAEAGGARDVTLRQITLAGWSTNLILVARKG